MTHSEKEEKFREKEKLWEKEYLQGEITAIEFLGKREEYYNFLQYCA